MKAIAKEINLKERIEEQKSLNLLSNEIYKMHVNNINHAGIFLCGKGVSLDGLFQKIVASVGDSAPISLRTSNLKKLRNEYSSDDHHLFREKIDNMTNGTKTFWEIESLETIALEREFYQIILNKIDTLFIVFPKTGVRTKNLRFITGFFESFDVSVKGVFLDTLRVDKLWWEFWK